MVALPVAMPECWKESDRNWEAMLGSKSSYGSQSGLKVGRSQKQHQNKGLVWNICCLVHLWNPSDSFVSNMTFWGEDHIFSAFNSSVCIVRQVLCYNAFHPLCSPVRGEVAVIPILQVIKPKLGVACARAPRYVLVSMGVETESQTI